jgi:hypothetical protein
MIWIENKTTLTVQFEIMHTNRLVGVGEIKFAHSTARFQNFKIQNKLLMPNAVKKGYLSMPDYLVSRCITMDRHRNIYLTRLVTDGETRNKMLPFILSLSTNSISLADKYWINPKETTAFVVNGANMIFERKTWDEVDPFKNLYIPGQLEQYGLYDCFFIEKPEEISARSLILSTSGQQNKRWMLDNNGYYLEKKLYKQQFEEELSTLDFFLLNGIMVPKYDYYIKELNDPNEEYDRVYSVQTIQEGLHVIQKRCLTNSNSYLESLIDYVDNDDVIDAPIRRMFAHHGVPEKEIERFVQVLKAYQLKFDIKDNWIDTSNLGLLVDENGAHPVVWGRLQKRLAWNGQLE